ncbi:hypothetical protein LIER_34152 [Lithospermum erythrorhizon]|uniref:Retroviral polymerase SH3-like domain-containing protein n=1 Tax=Lithospermum erythrorhizon TaxID=34254 RepID=A0AAV3RZI8_LITER
MVGSSNEFVSTSSKISLFDKFNFGFWKYMMRPFMEFEEFGLINVIDDGEYVVETFKTSGEIKVEREPEYFSKEEKRKIQLNKRPNNKLPSSLNPDEYNRVGGCTTAKEMWDIILTTYEGTNLVKENRIALLTRKVETCFVLNPEEKEKFKLRSDEGLLVGYSNISRAYRFNKRISKVIESINVICDEKGSVQPPDDDEEDLQITQDVLIRSVNDGLKTRAQAREAMTNAAVVSTTEPKNIKEALEDT